MLILRLRPTLALASPERRKAAAAMVASFIMVCCVMIDRIEGNYVTIVECEGCSVPGLRWEQEEDQEHRASKQHPHSWSWSLFQPSSLISHKPSMLTTTRRDVRCGGMWVVVRWM